MAFEWKRSGAIAAAAITATMLAACGSSSVESAISPQRFIAFGDGTADVGQTGSRYTVNGADLNSIWIEQVASGYGKNITAAANGGLGYAQGNARINAAPDAAGGSAPSLAQQLDQFLRGQQFTAEDMVLVSAGLSEVVVHAQAAFTGATSSAEALENAFNSGKALSEQLQRMIDAGAKHILVTGPYQLAKGPWGQSLSEEHKALLNDLSRRFNDGLKVGSVDQAENVLYVDWEYYLNTMYSTPSGYSLGNIDTAVCNTVDSGAGIGTGTGQVNAALCNTTTVVESDYNRYLYADRIHLTPQAQRHFGSWAYDQVRERW